MISCSVRRVARSCRHQSRQVVRGTPARWKSSACRLAPSRARRVRVDPTGRTRLDSVFQVAHVEAEDRCTSRPAKHQTCAQKKAPVLYDCEMNGESQVKEALPPTEHRRFLHELPPLEELELWAEDAEAMLRYTLEHETELINADFVSSQFLAAISAWVQCSKKHSKDITRSVRHAERAHDLLMEWYNDQESLVPPPWIAHERVLHGLCRVNRKDDSTKRLMLDPQIPAQRAREIMDRMLHKNDATPGLFHNVIELCCKVTTPNQASSNLPKDTLARSRLFLEHALYGSRLLERFEEKQQPLDKSLRKSYKTVLRALSRTAKTANEAVKFDSGPKNYKNGNAREGNNEKAVELAEQASREATRLLRRMQKCYGEHVTRNFHYTELIRVWSLVPAAAGAKRAYALLREAEESPHVNFSNAVPHALVLNAYSQISCTWSKRSPANQALQILKKMEKDWLEYQRQSGNESRLTGTEVTSSGPNNNVLNDEQNEGMSLHGPSNDSPISAAHAPPAPDALCYSAVLDALAKSRIRRHGKHIKVYPAEVATTVLNRMEHLYKTKKLPGQPNLFCYGHVIRAWSQHEGDWDVAAQQAQRVLQEMDSSFSTTALHDLKAAMPHTSGWYNTVMTVIATKSRIPDAPQRVESILMRMEELYYDSVKTSSAIVVAPDSRSYHAAISAWARNGSKGGVDTGRALRARHLLDRMTKMHQYQQSLPHVGRSKRVFFCRPSVQCYNEVLTACYYTVSEQEKQEALRIAYNVFQELCESTYATPNAGTFGRMIQCFCRFLPPGQDRDHDVTEMIRMCCHYGEMNEFVLNVLKENCSNMLLESLFGPELRSEITTKRSPAIPMLPQEWMREAR